MEIKDLVKLAELVEGNNNSVSRDTFLEIGKSYCFRTVTMIYTGKIVDIRNQEVLITKAAWIADTGRWADFVAMMTPSEVEPYDRNVVIHRSSFLDYFIVDEDKLPRLQK